MPGKANRGPWRKAWTSKKDAAWDKAHGVIEGSKQDNALDKKRGVPLKRGKT